MPSVGVEKAHVVPKLRLRLTADPEFDSRTKVMIRSHEHYEALKKLPAGSHCLAQYN